VPTLRSLNQAHRRPAAAARRHLTVDLSHVSEMPDLPGTAAEAAELHARHPDGSRLSNEDATAAGVLAGLADHTWAHFACHAHGDLATPSQGGLRLHDRVLRLSEISDLRLEYAELAYLSACSTAHVGVRHANEAIHLASAFQLAGFRHVIASLWPLADDVAAAAARAFYEQMPNTPDANTAATALRAATMNLRETYPDRPDLWASLVHSGP
jgi:CHAT domain-containing protein